MAGTKWQEFKQKHLGGTTASSSFSQFTQRPSAQELYNGYAKEAEEDESKWQKFKRENNIGGGMQQIPQGVLGYQEMQRQNWQRQAEQAQAQREYRAELLPELEKKKTGELAPASVQEAQARIAELEVDVQKMLNTYGSSYYDGSDLSPSAHDNMVRTAQARSAGLKSVMEQESNSYLDATAAEEEPRTRGMVKGTLRTIQNSDAQRAAAEIMDATGWDLDTLNSYLTDAKSVGQFEYDKENGGTFLTPQEELLYSKAKIEALPDDVRKLVSEYQEAHSKESSDEMMWLAQGLASANSGGGYSRASADASLAYYESRQAKSALAEQIRELTGWDDATFNDYLGYAELLRDYQDTEEYNEVFAVDPNAGSGEKALMTVANTATKALTAPFAGGMAALGNIGQKRPEGFGRNAYTNYARQFNANQYAAEQVSENVFGGEATTKAGQWLQEHTGQNAAQFAYGTVSGILDSAATIPTTGLVGFGTNAYSANYREARERGLTEEQAQQYGIASGVAEALIEKIPMDNLVDMARGGKVGKNFVKEWAKQAGYEGSEEVVTSVANSLIDYAVTDGGTNGKTAYQLSVEAHMYDENGNVVMSEEEAKKAAMSDYIAGLATDFAGGAISGGAMGAPALAYGNANANYNKQRAAAIQDYHKDADINTDTEYGYALKQDAERYANNPTQYQADMMDDSTAEGKARKAEVQALATKEAQGKALSKADRNYIEESLYVAENAAQQSEAAMSAREQYQKYANEMAAVPAEYRTASTSITEDEARAQLGKAAATGNVEAFGEVYQKMKNAKSADLRSKADEIYSSYSGMAQSHGITEQQIVAFKTSAQEAYAAGMRGESRGSMGALSMKAAEAFRAGQQAYQTNKNTTVVESKSNLQKANALTKGGKNVVLSGVFSSDGNVITQDGQQVSVSSLNLGDSAVQKAYGYADTQPSVMAKNAYISNIKDGTNLESYNIAWGSVFRAGRVGMDYDKMIQNGKYKLYAQVLGEDTVRAMYDAGAAQTQMEKAQEATASVNAAFQIKKGSGVFEDARADKSDNMNTEVFRMIANVSGLNIRLVDDKGVLGKEGANAYFDPKSSTIVVGSHATAQAFHEVLGEFTKYYNSADYAVIKKAAMNGAAEILGTDLFDSTTKSYSAAYGKAGLKNTDDEMSDEMTNDYVVAILSTDKGRQVFAKYLAENCSKQQANSIKDKIANLYKSIVRSIKNIMSRSKLMPYQQRLLENGYKRLEQDADLFIKAFAKAVENYKSMEDGATVTGEKAFSVTVDATGRTLSEQQQDFFVDSKIRNKDGALKVMHHGSIAYGFSVFDIKKAKSAGAYGRGFYFSDSDSHAGQYGKTYDVYLNIVNPVTEGTHDITKEQLRAFVDEIANDDDYGIENYGYGATPASVTADVWGKDDFAMLQDINATCVGDFAEAVKIFNRVNGTTYDGIVAPTETIAFYSNQIKEVTNEKPTSDPDIRFSLKVDPEDYKAMSKDIPVKDVLEGAAPVEQTKTLIAVHNLGGEQLEGILDLGGLPCPSIAVIKAGMEHSRYGEVSIMFKKEAIDPEFSRNNHVYGGDAWTVCFPSIEYKLSDKVLGKVRKMIADLPAEAQKLGYAALDEDNASDKMNSRRGDVVDAFGDIPRLQFAFMTAEDGLGETILEYPMRIKQLSSVAENEAIAILSEKLPEGILDEGWSSVSYNDYADTVSKLANEASYAAFLKKREGSGKPVSEKLAELYKNKFNDIPRHQFDSLMKAVEEYRKAGYQFPKEFDHYGFKDALAEIAEENADEYAAWLRKTFDGLVEKKGIRNNRDVFDNRGNRRSWERLHDEATLSNITAVMKADGEKGAAGFFSVSSFQALATRDFKSIDDIHAHEGQLYLMDEAERKALQDEHNSRFSAICNEIMDKGERNSFIALDNAADCITEAVQKHKDAKGIQAYLKKYRQLDVKPDTGKKIVELMEDIASMPTEYFEAKPMRSVWFDEIAKAVIPSTTDQKVIERLEGLNIPYEVYEAGNEDARTRALAEAEDARFSIAVTEDGHEYVNVDVDQAQFAGKSIEQKRALAKKAIMDKFAKQIVGYKEDAPVVGTLKTAKEYAYADKRSYTDAARDAKMRASTELDALLNVSKFMDHADYEEVKEKHPEAVGGIDHYKTVFKVGNDWYVGVVNILNQKNVRTLYDVTKIRSIDQNKISTEIGSLAQSNAPMDIISRYLENNKKFSLDVDDTFWDIFGGEELTESASILEEGMEALKHQKVDAAKVRCVAHKIRKEFGSTISLDTLTGNLEKVFAYMQTEDHVNYNDMMRVLDEVATPVIDQATTLEGKEMYDAFVDALKGYSIRLTDTQKQEVISVFGSYGEFRRMMMPINISEKGTADLEMLWNEIAEASGGVLDADTTEGDMPTALYDALSSLRPSPVNNYGGNREAVSKDLAMRIVEEYLAAQSDAKAKAAAEKMRKKNAQYRANLRSNYEKKLKEARADIRNKYYNRGVQMRERNEEKIAQIRAKNRQTATNARRKRLANHEKEMISKQASALMKWLESPTEKHHVPREMVEPVAEFLYALDFVEPDVKQDKDGKWYVRVFNHSVIGEDGSRSMIFDTLTANTREEALQKFYDAIGSGTGSRAQRTWTDRMSLMKDLFDKVTKGEQFEHQSMDDFLQTIDPAMSEEFGEMLRNNRGVAKINLLEYEDLHTINKALRGITHAINQGNKAFTQNATIAEWADNTMDLANKVENDKEHGYFYHKFMKTLRLDMATPETFLSLNGADAIYKSLRTAFNTKIADIRQAQTFMQEVMKDVRKKELRKWVTEIHEFRVDGGTLRLTAAQMMSLYELSKRGQAILHMKGGVKADTINVRGKTRTQEKAYHLTDVDIQDIIGRLTEQQKKVADRMQWYLANECAKQGNAAAMTMYGYEKFTEKNYFPISTDKTMVATNNSNLTNETLNAIERSGFTKQVRENASNPILIRDIFDVFTDHATDMATYHGFAPALKDANRWFNFRTVTEEDGWQHWKSIKQAVNTLSGKGGSDYFVKFIKDINGNEKSQDVGNIFDWLIPNYKAAAVGANVRVIIQQPTSYFRAMNVLSPKYLLETFIHPKQALKAGRKMREQSEICWWKSQGYYETSIGKSMKQIVTGQATISERIRNASMWGAGLADELTWGTLYGAVTREQKALAKGQNISEEELDHRIKERFDEVVDKTQVVDSTLHRSQYMRSKGGLTKMQTAFMAEPTKSYNMLMEAMVKDSRDGKALGLGGRTARAAFTFVFTSALTAAAAAIVDAYRRDTDDEEWGEVYLEALKENITDNVNPLNMFPVIKDVSNYLIDSIKGEAFISSSGRMDMDAITSLIDAGDTLIKALHGEGNKTAYGVVLTMARPLSQVTGIPAYNLTRDLSAVYNAFFPDLKKTKSENPYAAIYDAIKADRDVETAVQKAMANGGVIADIQSGIASRYKSDYYEMLQVDEEQAAELAEQARKGYLATGMTDAEFDAMLATEWATKELGYSVLDDAIENGEGVAEAIADLQETKKDDAIVKHIVNSYASTIRYNRENGIDSGIEENVEEALKEIDSSYSFDECKKALDEKAAETAAKNALSAERDGYKQTMYSAIDSGSMDWQQAVHDLANTGMEFSDIKSALTSQYKEEFIQNYNAGKDVSKIAARIAAVKAYCDSLSGLEIPRKYGGDYYAYEIDKIKEWLEPKEQ